MDEVNVALVVALIKEATEKVVQAEQRLTERLERVEDANLKNSERQSELSEAVGALEIHVANLKSNVDRISKVLGVHKKKGIIALLVAMFSGAAIASGSLNYQSIIDDLLRLLGVRIK